MVPRFSLLSYIKEEKALDINTTMSSSNKWHKIQCERERLRERENRGEKVGRKCSQNTTTVKKIQKYSNNERIEKRQWKIQKKKTCCFFVHATNQIALR